MLFRLLALAALFALAACGDLPRPFAGNPGATALRLAQPPPARLAVLTPDQRVMTGPSGASFAKDLAAALADQDVPAYAEPPRPGDWRLVIGTQPATGGVLPVFTVQDQTGRAQGTSQGVALDAPTLNAASPTALHQASLDAAAKVAAMLTQIQAARDETNPDSLLNRPARVAFSGVTGAPGDGNTSLAKQMRISMQQIGSPVQDTAANADFTLTGQVTVTPAPSDQQSVEVDWVLRDTYGRERGKVVQLHDIPRGLLDHFWGDVALVVAQQAAGGVRDVIIKESGTRVAAPPAASESK